MGERLLIGIDGGGTRCRARLRDESGRTLGEGLGGSANIRLGRELVWDSILTACREALRRAGLKEADLGRAQVGLGLAGAAQGRDAERILAHPHPFAAVALATDAHIAWLGAFGGEDGAIVIVGTGSCGYGVTRGKSLLVGGWGFEISDEGSGAVMGREALRRALWTCDGRAAATPLSEAILTRFGGRAEAVVDWVGQARPSDYAGLAPLILDHAASGDPLGHDIVASAANEIARIADRLLALGAPALCLFGGLAEPLRAWFPPHLDAAIVPPLADPLEGGIILARTAAPH